MGFADNLYCPSHDEITGEALKLLPRGRAWRSREGGPETTSTLYKFWRAVAFVYAYLTSRLCALRLEFWCATMSETEDQWMKEYGLPDYCEPFPDLCVKVAALGGTRCEYYTEMAARFGWNIVCDDPCGSKTGCFKTGPGTKPGQRSGPNVIIMNVMTLSSPAYATDTGLVGLNCLLRRIMHAENDIKYVVVTWL